MKKLHLGVDLALRTLDELRQSGIKEVMSTKDTIQPSSRNGNEARLFAIEASESQEAETSGRPRLRCAERHQVVMQVASLDSLLPHSVAALMHEGLVTLHRVAQIESKKKEQEQEKVRAVALWFAIAHNLMRAVVLRAQAALAAAGG